MYATNIEVRQDDLFHLEASAKQGMILLGPAFIDSVTLKGACLRHDEWKSPQGWPVEVCIP